MADLQTLLSQFLTDLYSGTVGATNGTNLSLLDGTATLPALRFVLDTNTGIARTTTDYLGLVAGGAILASAANDGASMSFRLRSDTPVGWSSTTATTAASDSAISRLGAASLAIGNGTQGDFSGALKLTTLTINSGTAFATSTALTNNAAAQTATLTNGPTAGNPTKWFPINDNGTTRNIPAW